MRLHILHEGSFSDALRAALRGFKKGFDGYLSSIPTEIVKAVLAADQQSSDQSSQSRPSKITKLTKEFFLQPHLKPFIKQLINNLKKVIGTDHIWKADEAALEKAEKLAVDDLRRLTAADRSKVIEAFRDVVKHSYR